MNEKLQKLRPFWDLMTQPEYHDTFELLKRELAKLIKHIFPRQFRLSGIIGLEDPAATGMIFALLASLMPLIGGGLDVQASFDEPILEVDVQIKGKIRVFWIACFIIRMMMDKKFRKIVRIIRKGGQPERR